MTADSLTSLTADDKPSALTSADVELYLAENPDFFIGKESLIRDITFPHVNKGTVSLVERQIALLREQNNSLQVKMDSFISSAKKNDILFEKIRLVILELLHSRSVAELSATIATKLSDDFSASASKLVFIGDHDGDSKSTVLPVNSAKQALGDLFDKKRTFCGPFDKTQAKLFFPDEDPVIICAAIIPVRILEPSLLDDLGLPMLVIGSDKAQHFNNELDTLFLDFIGEVLASHITQLLLQPKNDSVVE